jgi:hypothetical protein
MGSNFEQFIDKKVTFVRNEAGKTEAEEVEGTVVAVNGGIVMLKPKGKTTPTLIPEGEIENMDFAADKAKSLTRKTLKVVEYGQARAHLLERHGAKLALVNKLSEKEAFEQHKEIDHENEDLGHVHGDKPKPEDKADEA